MGTCVSHHRSSRSPLRGGGHVAAEGTRHVVARSLARALEHPRVSAVVRGERREELGVDVPQGQDGTVMDQVPANGHGRVRLVNEEWRATSSANLSVGETVRVLEVRGNTLVVGKA